MVLLRKRLIYAPITLRKNIMENQPSKQLKKFIIPLIAAIIIIVSIVYYARIPKPPAVKLPPAKQSSSSNRNLTSGGKLEKHVLIVLEENTRYSDVIGNTKDMPYLNSLANTYAYAKNYYANTHPSIGNYFMLTAGNVITNNSSHTATVPDDNLVRHLVTAGKTWKEYSESLPSVGFTGSSAEPYDQDHTPLAFYSDVRDNPDQAKNLVPFSQFAADLAGNKLPDYSFIIPNSYDDADGCPPRLGEAGPPGGSCNKLAAADTWLMANIDPLLKNSNFNSPGGGLLIITFDESAKSDKQNGGGHAAWVVAGPDVKKGYVSDTLYQHENTLRFMAELLGLTSFPGKAAGAAGMNEFMAGN